MPVVVLALGVAAAEAVQTQADTEALEEQVTLKAISAAAVEAVVVAVAVEAIVAVVVAAVAAEATAAPLHQPHHRRLRLNKEHSISRDIFPWYMVVIASSGFRKVASL